MNKGGFTTESRPIPDPTTLTTQQLLREVDRLQGLIDKIPAEITSKVSNLQELHEEKFSSIATQFAERDKADKSHNEANAAAIAKSEAGFTKQIDQITTLISANAKNADDKTNDLKDRIVAMESGAAGSTKTTDRMTVVINLLIAGAVGFVVFMGGVVGIIVYVVTKVH
jgi:hypothetical protein